MIFQEIGPCHEILDCGDFYISYRESPAIPDIDNVLLSLSGAESPEDKRETAIVSNANFNGYAILSGDHRIALKKIAHKGFSACIKYYQTQLNKGLSKKSPFDTYRGAL